MTPELGLTQYRFGAVVLILKQTLRSDGLVRRIDDETWLVNGPERRFGKTKFFIELEHKLHIPQSKFIRIINQLATFSTTAAVVNIANETHPRRRAPWAGR